MGCASNLRVRRRLTRGGRSTVEPPGHSENFMPPWNGLRAKKKKVKKFPQVFLLGPHRNSSQNWCSASFYLRPEVRFLCLAASNWIPGKTAKKFCIAASALSLGRCARRRLHHFRAGKRGPKRRDPGSTKRPHRRVSPPLNLRPTLDGENCVVLWP